jgi:carotenoid cleavage dioxygenase
MDNPIQAPTNIDWETDNSAPILQDYPSGKWWMHGNYGPVLDEIESFELEIQGAIPPDLNGIFLRNSPNPKSGDSGFWFMGDGMLHGVRFSGGKALWYRNRWIQTDAIKKGGFLYDNLASNRANTSLVQHGGRTLAMYELSKPYEIDPWELSTVGIHDFDGQLPGAMAAHPKIDPETGEMWFLSASMVPSMLHYYVVDSEGVLIDSAPISVPKATMMHDFQLTRNYAVILDLPYVFTLGKVLGGFPFTWEPSAGARIGLIPRYGPNRTVRWIDIDPCFIFHTFNAHEDAQGRVVLEGCRLIPEGDASVLQATKAPTPWQWTLDFQNRTSTSTQLLDLNMDFPVIDRRRQGLPNRFNYGLHLVDGSSDYPAHPVGITKFDRQTGAIDLWTRGEAVQPDEALFVPATGSEGEDDGWLISMVYDRAENRSEVIILDATQISTGPIARIAMPRRVPFGFHGVWIPDTT